MKKIFLVLSIILILSCDGEDYASVHFNPEVTNGGNIANELIATEESHAPMSLFSDKIRFNSHYETIDGGCSIREIYLDYSSGVGEPTPSMTSNFLGPDPYTNFQGYVIRGYGGPYFFGGGNALYGGVSMRARKRVSEGSSIERLNTTTSTGAISIEYEFLANNTYIIELRGRFFTSTVDYDTEEADIAMGLPTLHCELKNSAIIPGNDPCDMTSVVPLGSDFDGNYNQYYKYHRKGQPDTLGEFQIIRFKFSPTENKHALLLSIRPGSNSRRMSIGSSQSWSFACEYVDIRKTTFDPSLNDTPPRGSIRDGDFGDGRDPDVVGGGRN